MPELASEPRTGRGQLQRPDPRRGVFETLLVLDGRPVELDAHLNRLKTSLAELFPDRSAPDLAGTDVPLVRGQYGYSIDGTSAFGEASSSLRITVAPDADGGLETRTEHRELSPGAFMSLSDTKSPGACVSLRSLRLAGGLGAHKWADRSLLDAAQAELPPDTVPLIVDADGSVLEASRANVFAVRAGTLVTPPTDGRILPGVTRMRVLELAADMQIGVQEVGLSAKDLLVADEVFLTGSVRGIERVAAIDGVRLPDRRGVTGRVAAALHRAWADAKFG